MTTIAELRGTSEKVELLLRVYLQLVPIREFETHVNELYTRALMPGRAHLYIGEEAVAVCVCEALERADYITSTHARAHCWQKSLPPIKCSPND